jgi:hypothetical protein
MLQFANKSGEGCTRIMEAPFIGDYRKLFHAAALPIMQERRFEHRERNMMNIGHRYLDRAPSHLH